MVMYYQTKFGCKWTSSHILIIWGIIVILTSKMAKAIFSYDTSPWYHVWLQKVLGSEDIVWVNINWNFKHSLCPWHCTQQFIFSQGLCWCSINLSLVAKDLHIKRDSRNSHILIRWASRWPWPWRYQTNYLAQHSNSWWCNTTSLLPGLVTKGWAVQEMCPGQKSCSQTDRHTDSYTQPHTSSSVMGIWLLSDSLFPHPQLVFKLFQLNDTMCVCVRTCVCVWMCVCLDMYMSLCVCARMYVCIM